MAACSGQQQMLAPAPVAQGGGLIGASDNVRSIQLYAADEQDLPVLNMHGGPALTLEFDLMTWQARPLSVYFYHADREWRRDLSPGEFMESFFRDDLLDYSVSRNTQVPFTHYRYRFPNESIGFRISGNYVLRVTEQGSEDEPLFERPFFVAEGTAQALMSLDLLLTGPQVLPVIQPRLVVTPPTELTSAVFDMTACFIEGGRLLAARCTKTPRLGGGADMLYYLEPEVSYGSRSGDYLVDIADLAPRGDVERIDLSTTPFQVLLQPDYARFPDTGSGRLLNGQSVIGGRDEFGDIEAEYVEVTFRYVPPDEQPLPGDLYVIGSFNNWQVDLGAAMRWESELAWYESAALIKQGLHEYRYTSPDLAVRRMLESRLHRHVQWYTGLVYFRDHRLSTDRLLARARILSR